MNENLDRPANRRGLFAGLNDNRDRGRMDIDMRGPANPFMQVLEGMIQDHHLPRRGPGAAEA